jgi:4-diphosphocytidyl-2-C-methyl-D-erythritol kinase
MLTDVKIRHRPDISGMCAALGEGRLDHVARYMYNVFEELVGAGLREIGDIKSALIDSGALGAVMSGSGPAVFGIFDNEDAALAAYGGLKKDYDEVYICRSDVK